MASPLSFNKIPLPLDEYNDYFHRPMVATNEYDQSTTLEILREQPILGNTLLGVGGFLTLNIAAIRGSESSSSTHPIEKIIVFDRGIRVEHFWNRAHEIIRSSDNRLEVAKKIKSLLQTEASRYFPECGNYGTIEQEAIAECHALDREITNELSWLSNDTSFAKIHDIFFRDCFIFKRVDLFDQTSIEVFAEMMQQENIVLDSVYLSNIGEYCMMEKPYLNGINKILSPHTFIISAHFSGFYDNPVQYVMQKKTQPIKALLFPQPRDIDHLTLVPYRTQSYVSRFFLWLRQSLSAS